MTIRYYLSSAAIPITKPATTCHDEAVATSTAVAKSTLSKKHLTLACYFCREYFSVKVASAQ